jgi:CelD/BcsL family acetyltransferase involved in cellulose biosynthesis
LKNRSFLELPRSRAAFVYVRCIENLADLEPMRAAWDALAGGCPFRSWSWISTWWRHYGAGNTARQLQVWLAFRDATAEAASLIGVLPTYVDASWTQGSVLRLLGDGEVCSDHIGLLTAAGTEEAIARAVAAELLQRADWDLLDFAGVDADDAATSTLLDSLALGNATVTRLAADRCWAIDLPSSWDEFLAMQSKSHRKQLRQLDSRVIQPGRADWKLVESADDFATAWSTLVDLHQRRRQSLGEPGCFASRKWAAFQWDVAQHLLAEGRLRLSLLTLDGRPIAAEYHMAGAGVTYAYQGGVDPDRLHDEPGQLSTICSIKRAFSEGHRQFDFLRGDEPYKAHWRASPRPTVRLVAVPSRTLPRLRYTVWSGVREVARAARQLTAIFS